MKNLLYNIFLTMILAGMSVSCSNSGEQTSDDAKIQVNAEQEQAAINAGRVAARNVLSVQPEDTFGLQQKLLEARSIQSRYVSAGRKAEAQMFDTAFIHTLRAVRPDIAREIELMSK